MWCDLEQQVGLPAPAEDELATGPEVVPTSIAAFYDVDRSGVAGVYFGLAT
jgi:hypothetical protein